MRILGSLTLFTPRPGEPGTIQVARNYCGHARHRPVHEAVLTPSVPEDNETWRPTTCEQVDSTVMLLSCLARSRTQGSMVNLGPSSGSASIACSGVICIRRPIAYTG